MVRAHDGVARGGRSVAAWRPGVGPVVGLAGGVVLGLAGLFAGASAQATGAAGDPLRPCAIEGWDGPASCGEIRVAEDPRTPAGRRLGLNVVVLHAVGPDSVRAPDPVFVLDGGPGQAATRAVEWVVEELAAVLGTRDVVLVDRRGTGGSNPLDCPAPPGLALVDRLAR
ncbi:MAG: hypothetical protein R3314_15040, partial [Longimicrobiales bacterium]|nr:hypothetical protein [Longimicrobiales bacterium]